MSKTTADIPMDDTGNYIYEALDITNYDGDSFRMTLRKTWDFGFKINVTQEFEIASRIMGVDTPEIRDKRPDFKAAAYLARDMARAFVQDAEVAKFISMDKPDKYGRGLGDLEREDGKRLSEYLLEHKLGVVYNAENKALIQEAHEENIAYLKEQGLI